MPVIGIASAKGGCGASLVATNLGIALAGQGGCLLIDLHATTGTDDLLLDLRPQHSWADLLPVAGEVTQHHLELTLCTHPSGLRLLAAPTTPAACVPEQWSALLRSLVGRFVWVLLDAGPSELDSLSACDLLILVSTCDPPALRNTHRTVALLPQGLRSRTGLVLNQVGRGQPAQPGPIADSLGLPMLAALPPDPRAVGYQVHFGQPCVHEPRSGLGREITRLAIRLVTISGRGQAARETRSPRDALEAGRPA